MQFFPLISALILASACGALTPSLSTIADHGKQVEFGEYLSPGGQVFHGYVGVWMGTNDDPGFYSSVNGKLTLIYSTKGGWVAPYSPKQSFYESAQPSARIFKLYRESWTQVSTYSDQGLYVLVDDASRQYHLHTTARINGRVLLSIEIRDSTFVPGEMIGYFGGLYKITNTGSGIDINPIR